MVVCGDVTEELVGKIWTLRPTSLVVCSAGGDTDAAAAVVDYLVLYPLTTCVTGRCYSAAVIIGAAGKKGARYATPNAQWFLHPAFFEELTGDRKTMARERRQLERFERFYAAFLGQRTKKPAKFWRELMEKEAYLSADQALEYGLIDRIV